MKPKFKHDCESCTFLGHFYDHDVWLCGKSLLARYSDEGHEYWSMPKASFVQCLETETWAQDTQMRAIVAALCCHELGDMPKRMRRFDSISEIGGAVERVKWDMLFGASENIVPDPNWGLDAATAFNHFYIARSLLEQAGHHLSIAAAYDRESWKKFQEKQEATNAGAQRLAENHDSDRPGCDPQPVGGPAPSARPDAGD